MCLSVKIFASIGCFLALCLNACNRNATTKESITFNGYVYTGHISTSTSGAVITDSVLANATISCQGFPSTVKSSNDGSYLLTVETGRSFQAPNADIYKLQVFHTLGDSNATVYGKPGDTLRQDFVLYKLSEE